MRRALFIPFLGFLVFFPSGQATGQVSATPKPDLLGELERSYRDDLLELSTRAIESSLLNDAERLVVRAGDRGVDRAEVKARCRAIQDIRLGMMKGKAKDAFKAFVASKPYESARRQLRRDERRLARGAAAHAAALARENLAREDRDRARRSLELVYAIEPGFSKIRPLALRKLWDEVREAERGRSSLARLEIGAPISDHQITIDDLEGKVVLWRSTSL